MAPPVVSVLLTVYNRERYLVDSIESVLAQSFGDFELVIVDDHSADGSVEIARRYERLDHRVRVVINDRNLGQFPNRNHAASLATAPFLKFHDSDDVMYPHCLAVMVAPLRNEPRAGFGLSGDRSWPGCPVPRLLTPRQAYQREFLGFGLFMYGPGSALIRTDVFRQLGGFADYGTPSDTIFWMRACVRYPVLLLPGDLFYYRTHPGQTFQAPGVARAYALVTGHAWRTLAADDCPLSEDERRMARCNLASTTAKLIWRAARTGDIGLAWARAAGCGISAGEWLRYLRRPHRSSVAGLEPVTPVMCR
jgi:glycosyltransferase involved in cell wall biosynthesis